MTRRATLRASDADREQVAELLRHAAVEGRLLAEELDERLGIALSARTYGELDQVVQDLPAPIAVRPVRPSQPVGRRPGRAVAVALTAVVILITLLASAFAGPSHAGHHWDGGSLIWLVWIAIGWRLLARRRGRSR